MTILPRAIVCGLAAFLIIGAGDAPDADVVAQRGDVRLTGAALKDALSLLDPSARAQVTASPQTLTNYVRERVLNQAVLAEAKGKNWDTQPDIQRRISEAREAVIMQTYLASTVPPDPAFPSEAEVNAAYEANKGHLIAPRQVHVAQIVLTVRTSASAEEAEAIHKKAIELRAQAVKPKADFAELAKRNSQETGSAEKGGDVGWIQEPSMIPQVREALGLLAEGGVSQPVRVPDGWHIMKVLDVRPGGPVPLLDAKPQIVQALRQARAQRMMKVYLDEMMKAQPIQVNEIELTKQVGAAK